MDVAMKKRVDGLADAAAAADAASCSPCFRLFATLFSLP
jgi:hypothetical protein